MPSFPAAARVSGSSPARARVGSALAVGALVGGALGGVGATTLGAQAGPRFDAELGAAVLRQPGVGVRTAPTLGGVWTWDGGRAMLRADGAVAAGAEDWAGQVAARAAYFALDPAAPLEIGAEARAARVAGARGTTQLVVGARRHLTGGGVLRPAYGLWLGASGGATLERVRYVAPLAAVEVGAWRALTGATRAVGTLTWASTRADSAALAGAWSVADGLPFASGESRVRTLEFAGTVEHTGRLIELTGSVGARRAQVETAMIPGDGAHWATIAIGAWTWWLRPGIGTVVTAGVHPADPARGLPAVQHVAFAIRLRPHAWAPAGAPLPAVRVGATRQATVPADTLHDEPLSVVVADGGRTLRITAPRATRVQVRAAATAWRPVDLAPDAGGGWSLALAWPAGAHRIAVRVDDGPWQAPANTPAMDDGFGGRVGLLVVP